MELIFADALDAEISKAGKLRTLPRTQKFPISQEKALIEAVVWTDGKVQAIPSRVAFFSMNEATLKRYAPRSVGRPNFKGNALHNCNVRGQFLCRRKGP